MAQGLLSVEEKGDMQLSLVVNAALQGDLGIGCYFFKGLKLSYGI